LAEGLSDDEMDTILSQMDLTVLIAPPSMLSTSNSFFYKMTENFLDVIIEEDCKPGLQTNN
jgi:hypothetical protein